MINFSLYHGTSSYFLDEILIHGLGGKNISNEWGIKDFFKEVIFECNKVEDRNFQKAILNSQQILDRILGNFHNPEGFNYRYGTVYLAVDHKRAIQYSLREFGSELSRIAHGWYLDLKLFEPDKAFNLLEKYPKIKSIFSAVHKPIVIEIKDIILQEIATEGGLKGNHVTKKINEYLNNDFDRALDSSMISLSFEYIGQPLMKERLYFYEVDYTKKNVNMLSAFSARLIPMDINYS
jgi:hypothetical protein